MPLNTVTIPRVTLLTVVAASEVLQDMLVQEALDSSELAAAISDARGTLSQE